MSFGIENILVIVMECFYSFTFRPHLSQATPPSPAVPSPPQPPAASLLPVFTMPVTPLSPSGGSPVSSVNLKQFSGGRMVQQILQNAPHPPPPSPEVLSSLLQHSPPPVSLHAGVMVHDGCCGIPGCAQCVDPSTCPKCNTQIVASAAAAAAAAAAVIQADLQMSSNNTHYKSPSFSRSPNSVDYSSKTPSPDYSISTLVGERRDLQQASDQVSATFPIFRDMKEQWETDKKVAYTEDRSHSSPIKHDRSFPPSMPTQGLPYGAPRCFEKQNAVAPVSLTASYNQPKISSGGYTITIPSLYPKISLNPNNELPEHTSQQVIETSPPQVQPAISSQHVINDVCINDAVKEVRSLDNDGVYQNTMEELLIDGYDSPEESFPGINDKLWEDLDIDDIEVAQLQYMQ